MQKVKDFLNSFPKGTRAEWARRHNMDPVRVTQIAGGHKGAGLEYASKIIGGSEGKLRLADFVEPPPKPTASRRASQ
jgi:hypothetical protein